MEEKIRLQKILSSAGVGSRRACEEFISEGRVYVNGVCIKEPGTKANPETDKITFDGKKISFSEKLIYAFNKPRKVISSMNDPEGRKCIGDFLKDSSVRLFPVGRLDYDVSGLIIITNDGEFANKLLHPKYEIPRTYIARVKYQLTEKKVELLTKGIKLDDGYAKVSKIKIIKDSTQTKALLGLKKERETLIELSVLEGRKHFVKKILEAVQCPVVKLSRVSFGPYNIKGIPSGAFRQINPKDDLLHK